MMPEVPIIIICPAAIEGDWSPIKWIAEIWIVSYPWIPMMMMSPPIRGRVIPVWLIPVIVHVERHIVVMNINIVIVLMINHNFRVGIRFLHFIGAFFFGIIIIIVEIAASRFAKLRIATG
jgi:hypothetical protein